MKKNESKRFDYFDEASKHRIVSEFVVSYFAHKINDIDILDRKKGDHWFTKEELAGLTDKMEYASTIAFKLGWRDFELMETPNGDFFIRTDDDRFRDLDELCKKYAGVIDTPESERLLVEKRLYPIIMQLTKEDRIRPIFTLQTYQNLESQKLTESIERLTRLIDVLERRVTGLEKLAGLIPRR